MGKDKFQISLDGLTHVYYAGQTVSGRLDIINSEPEDFIAIYVVAHGKAVVQWRSNHNDRYLRHEEFDPYFHDVHNHDSRNFHNDSEVYFNNRIWILDAGSEGYEDKKLQPGEHSFPFEFTLPEDIPASFKDPFGHIRYSVKAVMDRPWRFHHKSKALFYVIGGPLDLNDYPIARHSIKKEKTKMVSCLWCTFGPVSVELSLETVGVVPGGTLLATVDLENYSRRNIIKITLKFIRAVIYKAKSGRRTLTYELTLTKKKIAMNVESGQSCIVEREELQIPPELQPSKLMNCNIIDIEYLVEAKIGIDGYLAPPIIVSVPVLVGTIPLSENFEQAPDIEALERSFNPEVPKIETTYPDIAPPTFEESLAPASSPEMMMMTTTLKSFVSE